MSEQEPQALSQALIQRESKAPEQRPTSPTSRFAVSNEDLRAAPNEIEADWSLVKPSLRDALRAAIQAGKYPVYLFGDQGRGKTSAMAALYRKVSPQPEWIDLQRFVRMMQRCLTSKDKRIHDFNQQYGHNEGQLWERFVDRPELILVDDVGIRAPSDSVYELVYELVNRRGRRPAIYTSNIAPDKLHAVYDGRVASRMLCGTVIQLTGDDRRLNKIEIVQA